MQPPVAWQAHCHYLVHCDKAGYRCRAHRNTRRTMGQSHAAFETLSKIVLAASPADAATCACTRHASRSQPDKHHVNAGQYMKHYGHRQEHALAGVCTPSGPANNGKDKSRAVFLKSHKARATQTRTARAPGSAPAAISRGIYNYISWRKQAAALGSTGDRNVGAKGCPQRRPQGFFFERMTSPHTACTCSLDTRKPPLWQRPSRALKPQSQLHIP